jgi:hypothetical protein
MTVQTDWDDEDHTVIRTQFIGAWTWEEAHAATDTLIQMIDSVDYTIGVITDLSDSSRIPPFVFHEVRTLLAKRHPRVGASVVVSSNFMIGSLWKTIAQTYGRLVNGQYSFADTLDEARARIHASEHIHH